MAFLLLLPEQFVAGRGAGHEQPKLLQEIDQRDSVSRGEVATEHAGGPALRTQGPVCICLKPPHAEWQRLPGRAFSSRRNTFRLSCRRDSSTSNEPRRGIRGGLGQRGRASSNCQEVRAFVQNSQGMKFLSLQNMQEPLSRAPGPRPRPPERYGQPSSRGPVCLLDIWTVPTLN